MDADADEDAEFGDFDFDDEELKRLADEMSVDEPVTEPEAAESYESGAQTAEPTEASAGGASDGAGMDLFDLDDLDDLDDLEDVQLSSFDLGTSYFESGAYADAVMEFKQAVSDNDQPQRAMELMGTAQRRMRDFKGAVGTFRKLLATKPEDSELVLRVLYELGVTYEAVGKKAPASTLYKKIVAMSPDFRDGEAARRLEQLGG